MEKHKILIVGHGLAGATLAFKLYQSGIDFSVVNTEEYQSASKVAAGMINPIVFKRLNKSWMLDNLLPEMNLMYREIEKELNLSFYHPMEIEKLLMEDELLYWQKRMHKVAPYVSSIEFNVDKKYFQPFKAKGVVKGGGFVETNTMLNGMRKFWIEKGHWKEQAYNYNEIQITEDYVNWKGERYNQIVFCEGSYVRNNPFFNFVSLNEAKGELLLVEIHGLKSNRIINKNLFILPVGEKLFKIGATYEWDFFHEEITQRAKEELIERLEKVIKVPYKIIKQYSGVRPTVIDRRPILGNHPKLSKLYIYNGLGTKGVMLAPYFADMMFRILVKNEKPLKEIDVKRFFKEI